MNITEFFTVGLFTSIWIMFASVLNPKSIMVLVFLCIAVMCMSSASTDGENVIEFGRKNMVKLFRLNKVKDLFGTHTPQVRQQEKQQREEREADEKDDAEESFMDIEDDEMFLATFNSVGGGKKPKSVDASTNTETVKLAADNNKSRMFERATAFNQRKRRNINNQIEKEEIVDQEQKDVVVNEIVIRDNYKPETEEESEKRNQYINRMNEILAERADINEPLEVTL